MYTGIRGESQMGIAAFRRLAREVSKPAAWILFCVCATEIFIFLFGPSTVPLPSFTNMTELEWMIDAHLQDRLDNMEEEEEEPADVNHLLQYRGLAIPRIMYNRVPKCGSETVRNVLFKLAWFNDFEFVTSTIFLNYSITNAEQRKMAEDFLKVNPPVIYERHLHFVDFQEFGAQQPLYINTIRDPLDRLVSWYYFIRFQEGHIRQMPDWRRNMSYDRCVMMDYPECTSESSYFTIIPFFCGQSPMCRRSTPAALARAKRHLEIYFLAVGFLEDLRNFFTVVEYLLPQYFDGSVAIYDTLLGDFKEKYKTKKKINPSSQTRSVMMEKLRLEYDFYYFAKARFYRLLYIIKKRSIP